MAKTRKILLAGESWASAATHYKGFDQFSSVTFHLGAEPLVAALKGTSFNLRYMPAHEAQEAFPQTLSDLSAYDAVILSDIGANTLLLHPDTWLRSKRTPNRLKLLKSYVEAGGGLIMVGGYLSFQVSTAVPAITARRSKRSCRSRFTPMTTGSRCRRLHAGDPEEGSRHSPRPDRPLAAVAGFQRCDTEAGGRSAGRGLGRVWRQAAAGRRPPWQGPDPRLDLGYRPALAAAGIRRLEGLCAALDPGFGLALRDR